MLPLLTVLNHSEWRLCAWDMELTVGDRDVARKLFKIIRWTYWASKSLSDKVNGSRGSYIKPDAVAALQSRFKQLAGELSTDEKSLLHRFYKSSFWFTDVGLLYARWAEET
jgi:hypothetical protein